MLDNSAQCILLVATVHTPLLPGVCLYSVVGNIQVRLLLSQKGKVLQICEGEKGRISVPRVYKIMDLLREERFTNLIWCKYIRMYMHVGRLDVGVYDAELCRLSIPGLISYVCSLVVITGQLTYYH